MKTLAEFKRSIKKGMKIDTVYHQAFNGRDQEGLIIYKDEEIGIREVETVNTVSFTLKTLKEGKYIERYCYWPKSNEAIFNEDGSVTILDENSCHLSPKNDNLLINGKIKCITYKIIG